MSQFQYDRLTPEQLSKALSDANLGVREFCALTGADVSKVKRWLKPENDPQALEPPFWVTSWLTLYMLPHASVMAANVATACRYTDDETSDAA